MADVHLTYLQKVYLRRIAWKIIHLCKTHIVKNQFIDEFQTAS